MFWFWCKRYKASRSVEKIYRNRFTSIISWRFNSLLKQLAKTLNVAQSTFPNVSTHWERSRRSKNGFCMIWRKETLKRENRCWNFTCQIKRKSILNYSFARICSRHLAKQIIPLTPSLWRSFKIVLAQDDGFGVPIWV